MRSQAAERYSEMDLGQDSPVSCLQISLILTVTSVGKLELEQISLLKFIFRITSEFEFGSLPNSSLSAALLSKTPLLC